MFGAVELVDVLLQSSDWEGPVFSLLLLGIGLSVVYGGFNSWKRMRLIQDTPTETVRSAAAGRTELNGTGNPLGSPVSRPFGDEDCVIATYRIEEWEDDHDDDGGRWKTIDSGTFAEPFQLDDGTGTMRVEPEDDATFKFDDAHIREIEVGSSDEEPPEVVEFLRTRTDQTVPDRGGVSGFLFSESRRYTERWMPVGQRLYLLGATEPVDPTETNSSGLVLRRDGASGEFIISEEREDELVTEAKWLAPAKVIGGLAASAIGLYLLLTGVGL